MVTGWCPRPVPPPRLRSCARKWLLAACSRVKRSVGNFELLDRDLRKERFGRCQLRWVSDRLSRRRTPSLSCVGSKFVMSSCTWVLFENRRSCASCNVSTNIATHYSRPEISARSSFSRSSRRRHLRSPSRSSHPSRSPKARRRFRMTRRPSRSSSSLRVLWNGRRGERPVVLGLLALRSGG